MKEKREGKVEIGELACAVMEDLLQFIYTGDVLLTAANAVELLKAANYTNACYLERLCEEFLEETLSVENCLRFHHLAEMYDCQKLKKGACDFIQRNFRKVLELPEFLEITEKEVELYLSSDDIEVKEEEEIYEALVKWVKHKPETRRNQFEKLFSCIRLKWLSKQYVFSTVAEEEMVCNNPFCLKLVVKASTASDQCEPTQRPRKCLDNYTRAVVICGGYDEDGLATNSNICYVPSFNKWCKLANLDKKYSSHCTVEMDGFMYVISSNPAGVSQYNARSNSWGSVAPIPKAVSNSTAVVLKGCIYVVGGCTESETLQTVQKYSSGLNSWELVKPLITPRETACSVSDGRNIYTMGGLIDGFTEENQKAELECQYLDSCGKYDPRSDSWVMISPMSLKRSEAAATFLRENIFVMGGINNELEATGSCEVYSIACDHWSEIASLQVSRYEASATVVDNKIYVVGGSHDEDSYGVECYSEDVSEWQVVSHVPHERSYAAVTTLTFPKTFIEGCPVYI